jgi:hypothetical protein
VLLKKDLRLLLITGLLFACGVVLVLGPFVWSTPAILSGPGNIYLEGAMAEWDGQAWQKPGDLPFQLFQGTGFASWFYRFYPGDLMARILALKTTLMITTLITALLPLLFMKKATRYVPENMYALLSLKFCLTFFYAFILVPYVYLFWVPLMVSAVIVARSWAGAQK